MPAGSKKRYPALFTLLSLNSVSRTYRGLPFCMMKERANRLRLRYSGITEEYPLRCNEGYHKKMLLSPVKVRNFCACRASEWLCFRMIGTKLQNYCSNCKHHRFWTMDIMTEEFPLYLVPLATQHIRFLEELHRMGVTLEKPVSTLVLHRYFNLWLPLVVSYYILFARRWN